MVVSAYNPSYAGARGKMIINIKTVPGKKCEKLSKQ
jgi:hypothetical protein